ncbi:ABC transporter substrate-binding protein [Roseomonas sp. CECT 9278]|uniref:ABC transporter substrate-binding protein n=1 Tax=Roseomonas sp. CECT 9278 TaxID=2845823 RepID=UPI001E610BDB|nr:ABC transporter substrate-binding protein [Roseomonas sp. CECT 9278]CAH0211996.1 Leu/Ile/Val-binding protein [Roseomonas sp. CECT 9278]
MPAIRRRRLLGAVAAATAPCAAFAQANELRIGALFPFSGTLALLGDESFRGLELAVEERNAAGGVAGRPARLLRGDAADQAQAAAESRRLMTTERVAAIFGTYASPPSFAATQVAEVQGIPYFELGALSDSITERGLRGVFRTCPRAADYGAVAVDALELVLAPAWGVDPRALRIALLHEDGLDGQGVAAAQEAELRRRGLQQVERIGYAARAAEFPPMIQRLRGGQAEVVLHAARQNDILLFFRGLEEAGWRPRMVVGAGGGYSLSDTARAIGPAFEGVMNVDVPQFAVNEQFAPGAVPFADLYKRRFGADPRSGHSLSNFVGAQACLEALHRAGGAERDRVRSALLATDVADGGTANGWGLRFDERGQNTRARVLLMQWQGGRQVTIFPADAAVTGPRGRMGVG